MDSDIYVYVVLIAFAATYPFRMIPAVFVSKLSLTPYMQRLLDLIPYTAITALVFPGIFYCIENNQYASYAGTLVAILCSIARLSLSVTVLVTVAVSFGIIVMM